MRISGSDITSGMIAPQFIGKGTLSSSVFLNGLGQWVSVTGATIADGTYGEVSVSSGGTVMTLVTAQPSAHTWAATQTFTLAPVFTDASGTRTALGLGTLATQNGTFSGGGTLATGGFTLTVGATASISGSHAGTSSGTNTGDQTSIVGITGTKSQFNTAVSDGDIVYLDSTDTITGVKTMTGLNAILVSSSGLTVRNPADTFKYTITAAAIAADRTLNLPLITGTDTLASLGLAQTWTATQTFQGTPAAPTAAVDTNTTQIATTAFVLAQAASATPAAIGTAAVGTSTRFARADHVHGAAGSTTQVLYNNAGAVAGAVAGDAGLTYDATNDQLIVTHSGSAVLLVLNPGAGNSADIQTGSASGLRLLGGTNYNTGPAFQMWPTGSAFQGMYFDAGNASGAHIYFRDAPSGNNVITVEQGTSGTIVVTRTIKITSPTAGLGYATGAGGTVTQLTSKSTGVTLSKPCGAITLHNATLNADAIVSFTLTNTMIAATDVLVLNHISGGTPGAYVLNARCAAGSATIDVANRSAGNLGEAIVIQFVLIKGVNS